MTANGLFSLHGKTAFVTGASSGLGRHFARVLARAGARVAIAARRVDRLLQAKSEIETDGGQAAVVELDVTDPASVEAAFATAEAALGPPDVLINNAGKPLESYFLKMREEEWRDVLGVNLDGAFRVAQAGARRMAAAGKGGSIINTASMLSFGVSKSLSAYTTSKAAIAGLTRAMALELARDNIRVNALAPGYVETEFNENYLQSEGGQRMLARNPMRRAGRLTDLDGPLLLLASDAGSYMTGSIVLVDGGHLLATG